MTLIHVVPAIADKAVNLFWFEKEEGKTKAKCGSGGINDFLLKKNFAIN